MPEDPKIILAKAGKQLANAKEDFAKTEQIERLKKILEKEHAALLDTADPENRAQMKQLAEVNSQMQVIVVLRGHLPSSVRAAIRAALPKPDAPPWDSIWKHCK